MALSAHLLHFSIIFMLVADACAHALNTPQYLDRLSNVVQFGGPRDTKFVFCDREDCPKPSIKHLSTPPPQPVPAPTMLADPFIEMPAALSRAKVLAKVKTVKKNKRTPHANQYEYKPITRGKQTGGRKAIKRK